MFRMWRENAAAEQIALGAASVANATAAPAGTTHARLVTTGNCHFRRSPAGGTAATATDHLLTPGVESFWPCLPGDKITAIQDGASTGTLSVSWVTAF